MFLSTKDSLRTRLDSLLLYQKRSSNELYTYHARAMPYDTEYTKY